MDTVEDLDEIYVVSNDKFASHFEEWAKTAKSRVPVKVLNDGTTDDSNKRGAIGDISFVIDEMQIDDDLMVIAGDNFFTYSLKEYVDFFRAKDRDCPILSYLPHIFTKRKQCLCLQNIWRQAISPMPPVISLHGCTIRRKFMPIPSMENAMISAHLKAIMKYVQCIINKNKPFLSVF